jgi:hypothetical protein
VKPSRTGGLHFFSRSAAERVVVYNVSTAFLGDRRLTPRGHAMENLDNAAAERIAELRANIDEIDEQIVELYPYISTAGDVARVAMGYLASVSDTKAQVD